MISLPGAIGILHHFYHADITFFLIRLTLFIHFYRLVGDINEIAKKKEL